jgi:uncharacterized protein YbjT (DUF2867 family)
MNGAINGRMLVAGSTGYLGGYIVRQLLEADADFVALARSTGKLKAMGLADERIALAQVTDVDSLRGCCDGVDVVISCLGITRQKDGLTYMDLDYQANLNLLREAERAGVRKFIYISAFKAQLFPDVRLLQAKERFAAELLASERLKPCIIRPNGFFCDLEEIYTMASSGRAYVFDQGAVRLNPIHGEDLARFCLEAVGKTERELDIGGPELLSIRQMAERAFLAQGKDARVTSLPDWVRKVAAFIVAKLPEKLAGPAEFFLTVTAEDMVAPCYGHHELGAHFDDMFEAGK